MLLPLGPMLAVRLNFPVEHVGYLNAAFLIAAAIAGLVGSLCLDRFDRRVALSTALAGLALGTAAASLATDLPTLVICRVFAGLCGGPAVSLGLAVIGDVAPVEWRGRAMAAVAAGSSMALILGVPLALQLTEVMGWRHTFLLVGGLGLSLAVSAVMFLPSGLGRRSAAGSGSGLREALHTFAEMLKQRNNLLTLANGALVFSSINMLAMNLAPYFIFNLGSAESELKYLWAAGGVAGLVSGQSSGWLADRFGAAKVLWAVSLLAALTYLLMFVQSGSGLPVVALMAGFMVCTSARIVLSITLGSLAPSQQHRGRFMSLMSATNQAASATAMIGAAQVLQTTPSGALLHMDKLATFAIVAALLSPILISLRVAQTEQTRL